MKVEISEVKDAQFSSNAVAEGANTTSQKAINKANETVKEVATLKKRIEALEKRLEVLVNYIVAKEEKETPAEATKDL
ncbi:hypothetical protein ACHAPO_002850 [Fusarium lateritium]